MVTIDDLPDVVTVANHWKYFKPNQVRLWLNGEREELCTRFSIKGGWLERYVVDGSGIFSEDLPKEIVHGVVTVSEGDFIDHREFLISDENYEDVFKAVRNE